MQTKKRVLILGFGGTIAMVPGSDGVLRPAKGVEEISRMVPSLTEMAEVVLIQVENLDSTNINPSHWSKLIQVIADNQSRCEGMIVTHGTDTMSYTATAVSLALAGINRLPIVFTGSQLPLVDSGTDARFNLENSMKVVLQAIENQLTEVMVVFNERILRANRTIKTSEARFLAFDSPAYPYIGLLTAVGAEFGTIARKHYDQTPGDLKAEFQRGILTVDLVPGLEPAILLEVLKSGKCHGLLLKSLGAGNVPSESEYSMIPVIQAAIKEYNIPVLVSTKFVGGQTHMDIYEPGKMALDAGAIPTGDMTDVAAQVKFMWALAQGYREPAELKEFILRDIAGEISA